MKHNTLWLSGGRIAIGFFLLIGALIGRSAAAQDQPATIPTTNPAADQPPILPLGQPLQQPVGPLGQQPFPLPVPQDLTPSQSNTNQLNQLFNFETTPNICAKGEGYLSADFTYLKYPGTLKQYRYQLQGQYAFTDQIAAGAFVPGVTTSNGDSGIDSGTSSGLGDITLYGQYKFDNLINPEIIDITAQLDVVLPTGNNTQMRDTGKFGVRPLILAYKDFGQYGPGDFGLYGLFGFTITTNSDLRVGIAATYQINDVVGILEFFDQTGVSGRKPLAEITPGIAYKGLTPWELSVGVPVGINAGAPDWGVIAKLTYVFQN